MLNYQAMQRGVAKSGERELDEATDAAENVPKCFSLPSQHEDEDEHIPQCFSLPNLLLS